MRNRRMLLATTTVFFRTHTRVLLTLFVSLCITVLCLTSTALPPTPALTHLAGKTATQSAAPLEQARSELPQTVIRLFFILPHLLPHDN